MGDFPGRQGLPITVWTGKPQAQRNGVRSMTIGGGQMASTAWGTANLAIFTPIYLPFRYPVKNMFALNAATVTGNVDIGIYNHDLVRLFSAGSTAMAGASTMQFFAADLILDPGVYYFAYTMSGTTATVQMTFAGTATRMRYIGCFQQASALPLPATATIAAVSTLARIPAIGVTLQDSPTF